MVSTKDVVYRRILDYIEGPTRSPRDLMDICSLVCELADPQLAYYTLFYCGNTGTISEDLSDRLFKVVLGEKESFLDEASYCWLTLVNVRKIAVPTRVRLFEQILVIYTLTNTKRKNGEAGQTGHPPLKENCLYEALSAVRFGLSNEEVCQLRIDVTRLVKKHEAREKFEFLIKTYW